VKVNKSGHDLSNGVMVGLVEGLETVFLTKEVVFWQSDLLMVVKRCRSPLTTVEGCQQGLVKIVIGQRRRRKQKGIMEDITIKEHPKFKQNDGSDTMLE
jgi:hypothetical protein